MTSAVSGAFTNRNFQVDVRFRKFCVWKKGKKNAYKRSEFQMKTHYKENCWE